MMQVKKTLLQLANSNSTITVHKPLVEFTGSLEAGMMLSQLLYWHEKWDSQWKAKPDKEFAEELCLTKYKVRKARGELEKLGILKTKKEKFNGAPTIHYRLDIDFLLEQWNEWLLEDPSEKPSSENTRSNLGNQKNDLGNSEKQAPAHNAPAQLKTTEKTTRKEDSSSNSARARESDDPVEVYENIFPRRMRSLQREEVRSKVDDLDLWFAVVKWWAMNGYQAKSVGRILNKYKQTDSEEDLYDYGDSGDEDSMSPEDAWDEVDDYDEEGNFNATPDWQ